MSSTLVRHYSHDHPFSFYLPLRLLRQTFIIAMKYTYIAVVFSALWTLASSLPIAPIAYDVYARDVEPSYQSLSRRMPPAIPHSLSLKKSDVGGANEHWALHAHPQQAQQSDLHILHAVSDDTKAGVLQPEYKNQGTYNGPSTSATSQTVHLGDFTTKGKALDAIKDARKNVKLIEQFPNHNCVDFACNAVTHMVNNGHLPATAAATMNAQVAAHGANVRQTTDTADNRKKAGA